MQIPSSQVELIQVLQTVEQKKREGVELNESEQFALFLHKLESSWTYQEKGYGVK